MDFTAQSLTKAREAGYTDDEIWGYLSQQNKGFSGARDAGYSLDETMDYVSKNPSIFAPQGTSFTKEIQQIGPAFMESLGRPLESMGETAEVFGFNDIAEGLKGAITEPENYESAAARFTEPKEGDASFVGFAWQYAPRAIVEQTGQLVGSIATRVAGGIAGAPAGPAGVAAGAFVGPAVFEAAQIIGPVAKERAANNGRETPTKEDIAGAILTATGSGALNAIGARYLPGGEKATGKFFKRLATSFLGETPTEAGQSLVEQVGGTAFTEKGLEVSPKQAIAEGIIGGGSGAAITAISAPLYREPKEKKIVTEEEAEEQDIEGQSNIEAINLTAPAGDIQTKKDVSRIAELEKVKAENELLSRALEPNEPEAKRLDLENAAIDKEITRLQGGVIESAGLTPINQAERDAVAASKEETPTAIATRIEQTKVAMAGVEPTSRRYTELQDQLTADEGKLIEQQQAELAKKIAEEPAPPVSKQDTLDTDTIAGIRSGVASADPDMRELWAIQLKAKLDKRGSLTWKDIPQELADSMDTIEFGALKRALTTNPQAAIDLIEGKAAPTEAPTISQGSLTTGKTGALLEPPAMATDAGSRSAPAIESEELNSQARQFITNIISNLGAGKPTTLEGRGSKITITKSSKPGIVFQKTRFDENNQPVADREFTREDARDIFNDQDIIDLVKLKIRPDILNGVEIETLNLPGVFTYQLKNREHGIGTTPKEGFVAAKGRNVAFNRPLTFKELKDFEINPIGAILFDQPNAEANAAEYGITPAYIKEQTTTPAAPAVSATITEPAAVTEEAAVAVTPTEAQAAEAPAITPAPVAETPAVSTAPEVAPANPPKVNEIIAVDRKNNTEFALVKGLLPERPDMFSIGIRLIGSTQPFESGGYGHNTNKDRIMQRFFEKERTRLQDIEVKNQYFKNILSEEEAKVSEIETKKAEEKIAQEEQQRVFNEQKSIYEEAISKVKLPTGKSETMRFTAPDGSEQALDSTRYGNIGIRKVTSGKKPLYNVDHWHSGLRITQVASLSEAKKLAKAIIASGADISSKDIKESELEKMRPVVRYFVRGESVPQLPTPAVSETITPAAPEGISVGNRIKLGKSPQTYTVEEVIPQTETEKELGEQYYSVKNEKTGEVQTVEKADIKPVKRLRKGEAGGVLIPSREDFEDLGRRIYEKGMQFKTWADRMVAEFGDAVRSFLGDIWQAVSGIPAKINELAGYLPGKGEGGGVLVPMGEEPPKKGVARYQKKSQVAGIKNIGSVIDTPKGIKKTTEKIIKDRFLNVDDVSEANTAKAWNLIGKLQKSNPESEQTVGAINELVRETIQDTEADDVVKQSIGGAIMRNELYKYAIKLTAQGDNKMLNYLLNNRLAIASGAIDEGDAGRMLNALANLKNWIVRASDSEQSAFIEIAASRFFDTKKPTEDQVNKIKSMFEAVKTTKIDQEKELSAELEEVGKATGIDVAQKVIEAVESSVASRDPWLVAFEILRKELGEPLAGFSFKPFSMSEAIKAAIKPKLANYMKSMTEQGAKGLEATFWKTMSDQEKKSGPLAEVDAAINRNLAAIVKETLIKLGMKGKVDNTKMTLIEQVANILTNQKLTQEKMVLADKRVLEEINRREGEAIERAGENQDAIDAAEAEAQALRDAWNEAMGQQMNLPVSEATLGRLINNEMKEAGTKLSDIETLAQAEPAIAEARKRTIVNSIINKLYGIVLVPTDRAPLTKEELAALDKQVSELETELANDKKRKAAQSVIDARQNELNAATERRDAEKKRTEIPKRDYDLISKALNDKFNQMIEARQLKTKMAKAARDSKAELNKPDKQAESQIKRLAKLQSDTQDWAKAKKDEVKAIVQNDLRNTPDMGRKEPWKAMLVGQLKQAGVSDTQAGILADLVWNQHEKNALTREMDALNKAVEKGPIKGIVDAILNTPLSEQQKPEWRKEVIKKYLIDAGVASSKADNIAKLFDISLQKRFAEAQVKAAEEAMKGISGKLTPESRRAFQAFIKAIRAQVVNPGTDAAKEFGKQMGWKGFTPEQIAKINELDAITQDDKTTDAEKSVAIEKIQQIIDDVSLPPRVRDSIGQFFIGNVLLRITTFASQLEPIVYKIADTTMESIYSLSNPQLAWLRWGEFFNSFERAARETIFSFSNDVSRSGPMIEYLDQDQRQLRRLYIDGEKKWKAGNYSGAMKNLLFGHPFVTYRTLNALDDGMNSLLKDGYLIRYMESAMKMAKIPKGKRIGTIRQVLSARQMDIENMIERGIPKNDAIIYANERMFSTVTEDLEAAGLGKTESQEVVDSAINDSLSVLGKIRVKKDPITGEETEIENIGTPITKYTMKFYKYMARLGSTEKDPLTRAVMKVLGRWIIGFPTTFSRVFSRAMGYTPLTLYRHFFKGRYPLTYGTAMQSRQRLFEQMSFTVVMMPFIMMAARTFTGDDDEKKKKGINIYFTGMGPSKKFDPEVYAQWDGKYDRGTMVVEIDGEVVYTLDSKTSGPFAPYIYTMGAIDDWKWRVKNKVAKLDGEDADEVSNAIELGNHLYDLAGLFATTASKRSQLTGLFNMGLVNIRNSDDPITQMSRDLSFKSMPLVPIIGSGIADNLSDLFSQPIDNKTTKGAILSNTPIFGPMLGKPAFNAYGQQLGELNISQKMKKSFGIPLTAVKLKNENDEKINFITLSKGEGPSPLTIDRLEKEMESPLTEQEFEIGMKAYGKSNYDLVLESYDEYMEYSPKEFAKALKDISSYSRDVAIEAIEKHREKNP